MWITTSIASIAIGFCIGNIWVLKGEISHLKERIAKLEVKVEHLEK